MALTVSSIEVGLTEDTKTLGKQSIYLEFDFGGRIHSTDTLKSAGKTGVWEQPVQLTGAGITMKVIARASKTLSHDKALGIGDLNVRDAAGRGPQRVELTHELTGAPAGFVTLTISGGSPAISGLPHTAGHGGVTNAAAAALPGHHASHEPTGAGGVGAGAGAGAATGLAAGALSGHHGHHGGHSGHGAQQGIGSQAGGLGGQQGGLGGAQGTEYGAQQQGIGGGVPGGGGGIGGQQGGLGGAQGAGYGAQQQGIGGGAPVGAGGAGGIPGQQGGLGGAQGTEYGAQQQGIGGGGPVGGGGIGGQQASTY